MSEANHLAYAQSKTILKADKYLYLTSQLTNCVLIYKWKVGESVWGWMVIGEWEY